MKPDARDINLDPFFKSEPKSVKDIGVDSRPDLLNIEEIIARRRALIEARLANLIPKENIWPANLHAAQRHALLSPGKRLRPLLSVFIAEGLGYSSEANINIGINVGCTAEIVHAASLILDDLPCMDNADLRRGQATTHIAFDESTAILSATALLNRAFGVLAELKGVEPEIQIRLIRRLSDCVGSKGLIAGQVADLSNTDTSASLAEIERLNALKTGALFDFSIESAALLANASETQTAALKDFSYSLGLAFQLMDDVKDQVMSEHHAEKTVGRDIGKATILALSGSDATLKHLRQYLTSAKQALSRAELSNTPILNSVLEAQFRFLSL